jgi:hypothetical protein
MTRRRRRGDGQAVTAAALTVVAIAAATTVLHLIGWVAATAAVGAVCWYIGHRSRPVSRVRTRRTAGPSREITAERDRLGRAVDTLTGQLGQAHAETWQLLAGRDADLARLRGELADAKASAQAAWDAAADRPPARRAASGPPPTGMLGADQLAAQPMSGARPVGGAGA